MSFFSKVFCSFGIIALVTPNLVNVSAQINGSLSSPLSNSSFTYCNWNNMMATSDVEAARQIVGNKAYFYVTENTSLNVVNGKCVANIVANYVPHFENHKTSFDINSFGSISNVKIMNTSPEVKSVECDIDGVNTIIRFSDANQDVLKYNTIVGANDFDIPSTTNESNNVLKVTLKRKDANFTGSNNVTVYIDEFLDASIEAGYALYRPASTTPYVTVPVSIDKNPSTSKFSLTVKGVCNPLPNIASSSSSTTMSSSSSSTSSTSSVTSSASSLSSLRWQTLTDNVSPLVGGVWYNKEFYHYKIQRPNTGCVRCGVGGELSSYNPRTGLVNKLPNGGGTNQTGFNITASGNRIYTLGGVDTSFTMNPEGQTMSGGLSIYDLTTKTTIAGAPMSTGIINHKSVIWKNKMYVFGGDVGTLSGRTTPNDQIFVYDILDNSWSTGGRLPINMNRSSIELIGNRVYIINGVNIWVYNLQSRTLSDVSPTNMTNWGSGSTVLVGNKIHIFGSEGYKPKMFVYNPLTKLIESSRFIDSYNTGNNNTYLNKHVWTIIDGKVKKLKVN